MFGLGVKLQTNIIANTKISQLIMSFIDRVNSDGGQFESSSCIEKKINYI